jgi:hypothetical protein
LVVPEYRQAPTTGRPIGHYVEHALCRRRSDTGYQMHETKTRHPVARILREAQQCQHVLDVGAVEEFEAPNLMKGMLRRVSSTSSGPL